MTDERVSSKLALYWILKDAYVQKKDENFEQGGFFVAQKFAYLNFFSDGSNIGRSQFEAKDFYSRMCFLGEW